MLLSTSELLTSLTDHLSDSNRIDIATAWATEGSALTEILKAANRIDRPCELRAIVGINGFITTPQALRDLNQAGDLRIVHGPKLFHPKLYLFHKRRCTSVGWVGSANLTGKGFGHNEEVVLETTLSNEMVHWFERRWAECGPLDRRTLNGYCDSYEAPEGQFFDERLETQSREIKRVAFTSTRKVGNQVTGKMNIYYRDGSFEQLIYPSRQHAILKLIREASKEFADSDALAQLKEITFGRAMAPLLSTKFDEVYWSSLHKERGTNSPFQINESQWWLASDTSSATKRKFVEEACKRLGIVVEFNDSAVYGF